MGWVKFIHTSKVQSSGSGKLCVRKWTKPEHTRVPGSSGSNYTVPDPVPVTKPAEKGSNRIGDTGGSAMERVSAVMPHHTSASG